MPRRAIPGETDLATTHPELAAELVDPTLATGMLAGSKRAALWRCAEGHEWEAPIDKRTKRGFGCPYCSGKRVLAGFNDLATTHPELAAELVDAGLAAALSAGSHREVTWRCSLGHQWGAPIANRVAGRGCPYCSVPARAVLAGFNDLATTHPSIAAELVDASLGVELSAGSNRAVAWRCASGHGWTTSPNKRTSGRGCPYCAGKAVQVGFNDLASMHPSIAAELVDQSRGATLTVGSNRKVRWRCGEGHEWDATITNRVKRGSGCPFCSGHRAIRGETDLATLRPDLAAELVDGDLAAELTVSSSRRVDWRCRLGHTYTAPVSNRSSNGSGCPYCAGQAVLIGFNDLATTHPSIAAELEDQSLATKLSAGSGRRVEWRCKLGHPFAAVVVSRTSTGGGCPFCSTPARRVLIGFNDLATTRPDLAAELVDPALATQLTYGTPKKVRWRCATGHEWTASVSDRSFGNGCPECSTTGYSQVASGWLYLLAMPGRRVFKFGIANDLDQRLDKHRRQGFTEVIETIFCENGADALAAEGALIKHARAAGWGYGLTRSQMRDGWTETLLADDCGEHFTLSGFLATLDHRGADDTDTGRCA